MTGAALPGLGRARERNVAFAGQQPRRRIEPDPARAGNIGLGPRVQIGEIPVGPDGPSSDFTSATSWIR